MKTTGQCGCNSFAKVKERKNNDDYVKEEYVLKISYLFRLKMYQT